MVLRQGEVGVGTAVSPRAAPGRDPRRLARILARRIGLEVEALERPHLRVAGERLVARVLAAGEALAAVEGGEEAGPSARAAREGLAGCRFLLEVLAAEGAVARSSLREIATGIRVLERALPPAERPGGRGRGPW